MEKKHTLQLRHHVASTRRTSVSAFSHLRALLTLLVCSAAACSMLSGALLAFVHPDAPSSLSQTPLTFADRVTYQRAIEQVYWQHRVWPKERPDPKPFLDAVMPQAQVEKKVTDYLRNSQALEDYWQRPITTEQLQAEMDRVAQYTKQPEVLRELFEALEKDPFVIAECLARPVLSERLVRDFQGPDRRSHGDLKSRAASWRVSAGHQTLNRTTPTGARFTLPPITDGAACSDDTWTATSNTNAPAARASHIAVWTGSEMIVWGGVNNITNLNSGGRYDPNTDTWTSTSMTNAPDVRVWHTAVWTGGEMIVWGGYNRVSVFNTGAKYSAAPLGPTPTPTATPTVTATSSPTPTPSEPPCSVIGSQPPCGGTVSTQLTNFVVAMDAAVDPFTVQPSDFTVNGTAADNDIISGTTITFQFNASPVVPGENTMQIPAGAFNCVGSGRGVGQFDCTFTYQPSTPTPTATPTSTPRPSPTPRPALTPRPRPTPPPRP